MQQNEVNLKNDVLFKQKTSYLLPLSPLKYHINLLENENSSLGGLIGDRLTDQRTDIELLLQVKISSEDVVKFRNTSETELNSETQVRTQVRNHV